ncbi:MAG: hypothetical protein V4547_17755 [Bacteroidota bacterium]
MTLVEALAVAKGIGSLLSNSTITSACDVISDSGSTQLQKETACNVLVTENNNTVISTGYKWPFYNSVTVIHDTVNPNGPVPDRPM